MKIKSCPFCGGYGDILRVAGFNEALIRVVCEDCKCEGPKISLAMNESPDIVFKKAIGLWNKRIE